MERDAQEKGEPIACEQGAGLKIPVLDRSWTRGPSSPGSHEPVCHREDRTGLEVPAQAVCSSPFT